MHFRYSSRLFSLVLIEQLREFAFDMADHDTTMVAIKLLNVECGYLLNGLDCLMYSKALAVAKSLAYSERRPCSDADRVSSKLLAVAQA